MPAWAGGLMGPRRPGPAAGPGGLPGLRVAPRPNECGDILQREALEDGRRDPRRFPLDDGDALSTAQVGDGLDHAVHVAHASDRLDVQFQLPPVIFREVVAFLLETVEPFSIAVLRLQPFRREHGFAVLGLVFREAALLVLLAASARTELIAASVDGHERAG